jgi:hypothetical protein
MLFRGICGSRPVLLDKVPKDNALQPSQKDITVLHCAFVKLLVEKYPFSYEDIRCITLLNRNLRAPKK